MTVLAAGVLLALGPGLGGRITASAERNPNPPPPQQPAPQQPPPQQPPPPQGQQGEDLYGCNRTFGQPPAGHLVKRTNPAGGQSVRRGDSIVVTIRWDRADWSSNRLHKVLDCVAIDGELQPAMQDGESPTANDGEFTTVVRIPAGVPDGSQVCDQAMLSGPSPRGPYDRQISNQVCHTVSGEAAASCGGRQGCDSRCAGGSPCGGGAPCDRGCAERPPCDRGCGERPPCDRGCAERPPCDRGCAQPPPCDRAGGCAERPPCDRGCAQPPPCDRAGGCAERPPCDGGCAQRPPCDRQCGQGDCRASGACESDRPERDRDGRRGRDCDCDGHRDGLIRRIIHDLF